MTPAIVDWSQRVSVLGKTKTLAEWSTDRLCAVSRDELGRRLADGWDMLRALMRPADDAAPNAPDGPVERPKPPKRYKGVTRSKRGWQAQIRVDGKVVYLGVRETAEEAAKLYDQAVERYGLGRRTNAT